MSIFSRYTNFLVAYWYKNFSSLSSTVFLFYIFLFTWLFEWIIVFERNFHLDLSIYYVSAQKISVLLLVCFVFWIYVWGVSVWRRTQYGRFTRGDRKLWFKGFASFWVVEIVTLTGLLLVSCWMSWGPIVYIPRHFWFPKKSFIFELTIFTYVLWLVYLMRFTIKWQVWRTQYFITLIILIILFLLIWRDFITLFFREWVYMDNGSNWRFRKEIEVLFSISSSWWSECYMGHLYRDRFSYYSPIEYVIRSFFLKEHIHPFFFENVLPLKEYDNYNWLPFTLQTYWWNNIGLSYLPVRYYNTKHLYIYNDPVNCLFGPILNNKYSFANDFTNYSGFFYPRKVGFLPKRIAMWFFLVIIKIWHHFMLFIWWFFYLLRLINRKKSSYSLLSTCYFNLYCCYIIGFLVYLYHVLPFLSLLFRFRPSIQPLSHWYWVFTEIHSYFFSLFFEDILWSRSKHKSLKELAFFEFFKLKPHTINRSIYGYSYYFDSYVNYMVDYNWDHSASRFTNRPVSYIFNITKGIKFYSKSFYDASIDVYSYCSQAGAGSLKI